jgi:hypothetical protein
MYRSLEHLIAGCVLLILAGCAASLNAEPAGFLEGHLKIVSSQPVEPTDKNTPSATEENYADYPLLVLSQDGQKEIARVTADNNGNYRVELPPGDYILDVQGRTRGRVRAKPQRFTVISNQTVRVNMDIDLGRSPSSAQSLQRD